jgi:hypothetical protein
MLAHDPRSARVRLFGGVDRNGTPLNDSRAFDGTDRTRLQSVSSPPPRHADGGQRANAR